MSLLIDRPATGLRQVQEKLFYVSPFIEMAMRYHFRISLPREQVKLRTLETDRPRAPCSPRPSSGPAAT